MTSSTAGRPGSRLGTLVLAASLGLAFSPPLAAQDRERGRELIHEGHGLLERGKPKKALRAFAEANELEGGDSLGALLGLAKVHNTLGETAAAAGHARRVLELSDLLEVRAAASAELAWAVAGPDPPDEFQTALTELRGFLHSNPAGDLADGLRVRLCHARGKVTGGHPEALSVPMTFEDGEGPIDPHTEPGDVEGPRKIHYRVPPLAEPRPRWAEPPEPVILVLGSVIDLDGCVRNVELLRGEDTPFARDYQAAMSEWVFEPARVDGEIVPAHYRLTAENRAR